MLRIIGADVVEDVVVEDVVDDEVVLPPGSEDR